MDITLSPAAHTDHKLIKPLYRSAFPPEERPPFFVIRRKAKAGKGRLLIIRDGADFAGFLYLLEHRDMVYLFYLAIEDSYRGRGVGTRALALLREQCRGRRLFLARETLDPAAENLDQRQRRHEFYLRNGFVDWPIQIKEASVVYDVMGLGAPITAAEYDALITAWAGQWLKKRVDMRVLE